MNNSKFNVRSTRGFFILLLVVTIFGLNVPSVFAIDIVTRKSVKSRIAGKVTSVTKKGIKIKPQTGAEVAIPANDIEKIQWDKSPALLSGAIGQENNGKYAEAIKNFQSVLDKVGAGEENLRTDLQFFIARSLSKLALADHSRLPEAVARMKKFTEANLTSFRYYESVDYLGKLYLAQKDYTKAEETFSTLERSPFKDWQLSAKSSKADVLLAQNQVDAALVAFDQILKISTTDKTSKQRQLEARLGKANCLNLKKQPDEALKLLEIVVEKAKETDSRMQSRAQILRGNALLAKGKNQEALLAFLVVDVLFSGQQDLHAESLYNLSKLWTTVGQPGRADEAKATLESKYPNSPWVKKLTGE